MNTVPTTITKDTSRADREANLVSCNMHGIETAQDLYNKSSDEDKAKLRSLVRYERDTCVLVKGGRDWIRSHGMLKFPGKRKEIYNNGVCHQENDEAKRVEWFENESPANTGKVIAGTEEVREDIFAHFSTIVNILSEEIAGMQIARQMMGITGWIWITTHGSSGGARDYTLRPDYCRRYDYNFGNSNMGVVGLRFI